ncbi:MAG TPA: 50S ribosomal protein L15e [Candidatus Acidoferrales bacterium]|nr:50S ribosomal protein L15e [Candidatus Acidoferrales bacterium]
MSMYKHMQETFITEYKERSDAYKERIVKWNTEAPILRIDKPTNIARARKLGYKAKQGVIVVRVVVKGGKKKRKDPAGGRKPSKAGMYFSRRKSVQSIAEERAARKFPNCEVLNSYFVGDAGSNKFYEVILLDRANPTILSDKAYVGVIGQRNRVYRGLTSSGRKHRGLRMKSSTTAKFRPSKRQNLRN